MFKETITHLQEFVKVFPLNLTMLFQNFGVMLEANTTSEKPGYAVMTQTDEEGEVHVLMLEGVEQAPAPWDEFLFKDGVYSFLTELLMLAQKEGIEMIPDQDKAIDALVNL